MSTPADQPSFISFLPVSFFDIVMSLCGLSFSFGWAVRRWHFPAWPQELLSLLAVIFFVLITIAYIVKFIRYPALVKAEFTHPVSSSFFATFIISLLLLPGILLPYSPLLAILVWGAGAVMIFIFAWVVIRRLLDHQQEPGNAQPAWILPVVGTLDVPIVGYRLPLTGIHEICLLFFGIGLLFGIILLTIILSRLIFQPALPEALQPTLLILVGPFALAFSGYESLSGQLDMAASVFYYFDLFLLLIFASKIFLLTRCCPFRVTWWAVGFPLVAITLASFRFSSHKAGSVYNIIPAALLIISSFVIIYLLSQTLYRFTTGRLLLPQNK